MNLKQLSAVAAFSVALAGPSFANGVALSETQLDDVVGGTASHSNRHYSRGGNDCSNKCGGGGLLAVSNIANGNKFLNGNAILSGNEVNVLNGNNTAIGVGILGTGANMGFSHGRK